eukprot:gene3399-3538_t
MHRPIGPKEVEAAAQRDHALRSANETLRACLRIPTQEELEAENMEPVPPALVTQLLALNSAQQRGIVHLLTNLTVTKTGPVCPVWQMKARPEVPDLTQRAPHAPHGTHGTARHSPGTRPGH